MRRGNDVLNRIKEKLFGQKFRVLVSTKDGLHFANQTLRAKDEASAERLVLKHYRETGKPVKIIRVDKW